jgi:hypothetical protein
MYSVSELFKVLVGYRDRQFELKAVVDGVEYLDDQVVDFEIEDSLVLEEDFTIGTVNASKLIISLRTLNTIATNAKITPYIRLKGITWAQAALLWEDADFDWAATGSEWLKLGDFYIESRSLLRNHLQRFTCLDKLITAAQPFTTSLVYPETMQNVFDEIMTTLGMTADSSVVIDASYEIPYEPDGADYSFRDILSYIASSNSSSIKMTKNGEVGFVKFNTGATATSIGEDLYITAEQTNPVKTITKIVVTYNSEGETLEEGTGDEENTLYLYNPFITEDIIDDMFAQLEDFSYTPYSLLWRGNVYLETGDNISITVPNVLTWEDAKLPWADADFPWEQDSLTYESLILQNKMTFRGGLITSSQAQAKSYQETEFDYKGSISETVKNLDKDAVKLEEAYYGVVIGRTSGINIEKSDSSSKVTFNSDVLEWTVGGVQKLSYNSVEDRLDYTGSIVITAGSGIANLADAGGLATEDAADFDTQVDGAEKPENNATVGADWSSNLLNIPETLGTPSGTGLFLSAANLGYYDSGVWKTYMDNLGNFYLGGTSGKLQWDAVGDALTIMGSVTITAGSGIANLSDAGDLATRDTVNETYIDDNSISTPKIQANAVTANEISVATLSAITANLGTVTAGSITSTSTINVTTDLTVGDNINIGSPTTGDTKEIVFFNGAASSEDAQITAKRNNYPTDLYTELEISSYDISFSSFNRPNWGGKDIVIDDDLDDYATESWVEANHNLDTITGGTGITIGGTATDRTVALNTTYTDGRYAFYNTVQTCIGAGTGGTKTIDYINATATGLVVWFTDATNETIYY